VATSSISGLASGLDTASLINQLMQLEAVPQTKLKTRVSTEQSVITAMQTLNTKVSLVGSKAEALAKSTAWSPVTASSSNTAVTVTADTTARPTSLNVTVLDVAKTHQVGFTNAAKLTDSVTGASTSIKLDRFDGSPVTLSTDGTLKGVVDAINNTTNDTGLRASAIKVGTNGSGEPQYQLFVESTKTGTAEDFQITAEDGSALLGGNTVRAGSDARISLGTGITVRSTSNTFEDVVDGVDVTLDAATTNAATATVTVARDTSTLATQVQGLVDTLNAALSEIGTATAYDAESGAAGKLIGEAAVRNLRSTLLNSVFGEGNKSLASVGIQTTRDGKLTFDATKFKEAYAADPTGVAEQFTTENNGFASRLEKAAKTASNTANGTITMAITGRKSEVTRLEDSIDAWDLRLELRRTTLERQFTALETAMSQMSSQSEWLAAQISSLSPSKD
jgi:flagellar hook-associated protein 2